MAKNGGKREGAGRKKGVPNKVGAAQKEFIANILSRKKIDFEDAFDSLTEKDKVGAYIKLMEFVVKKPTQDMDVTTDGESLNDKTIPELKAELKAIRKELGKE